METHVKTNLYVLLCFTLGLLGWLALSFKVVRAAPASIPRTASIQSLIDAAADGDVVSVPIGTFNESLTINKNLTLRGDSNSTSIIQAVSGQRVITVTAGHNLRLQSLRLTGGNALGDGGAVLVNDGSLRVIDCWIMNNSADYGGAIFQEGSSGRVDVIDSRILSNTATLYGGGLFVRGNAAITNSLVLSNTAGGHGGGLHTDIGHTDLVGGAFNNNRALGDNGGAVNVNNSIDISGTQLISNTAVQDGAGVLVWNPNQPVNVVNARFERNVAMRDGGGLWTKGNLTVTNSVFISNTADSKSTTNNHGGGIYFSTGSANIISTTFTSNGAYCTGIGCPMPTGGGIEFENAISATVQDSLFDSNYSWEGGGIISSHTPTLIQRTMFRNNSGGGGGGISAHSATILNSDFVLNNVVNQGGALAILSDATISATRFISNAASPDLSYTYGGGGAIVANGNLTITNALFAGNRSLNNGAALQMNSNGIRNLSHLTIAYPTNGIRPAIKITNGTLNITNTIVASYTIGISQTGGTVIADYNLFFGGTAMQTSGGTQAFGLNNLTGQDPRFVDPRAVDYHLRSNSPAIGAGKNLDISIDLDGKPRMGRFDIGAYQFWTNLFLPVVVR